MHNQGLFKLETGNFDSNRVSVQTMNDDKRSGRMGMSQWLVLAACVLLFIALRAPWVGHLLTFDEAANLCGVRAFVGGGLDYWTKWFWHHPPLFGTLLLFAKPLEAGFAERAEWMMMGISALNLIMLFVLTRASFGPAPALWVAFCYAVMPAARCYDLWLKQDSLAVLFGLLAVYAFYRNRPLYSGLALGLAFLAKEVAMFYAAGIAVLWFLQPPNVRRFRDLLMLAAVAIMASAWWYILFSISIQYFIAFAMDSSTRWTDVETWAQPWSYFLQKLPLDLGHSGVFLCLAGLLALRFDFRRRFSHKPWAERTLDDVMPVWFLPILLVGYVLFSISRGKAAWFTSTLYPLLAVPLGLGVYAILRLIENTIRKFAAMCSIRSPGWPRLISGAAAAAFALQAVIGGWNADYEEYLRKQSYWTWWGADSSRKAALMMNRLVRDGERILITPMNYWALPRSEPCAVFIYYLKPVPVILRRIDTPLHAILADIRTHRIDWIMISPVPEVGEKTIIGPIVRQYGLSPLQLRCVYIFKTDRIYKMADADDQSHE